MILRGFLFLLLFWMIARAFWRLMDGIIKGATSASPQGPARGASGAPTPVKMAQCPVCGTYVVPGKAISLTRGGQVEYFCSDAHRAQFDAR